MKDSRESYGTLSKSLHWLMAVLIGWQFLKFGDRIADGEHWVADGVREPVSGDGGRAGRA